MHARTDEACWVALAGCQGQAQHHQGAPGHILAQEVLRGAADDDGRLLVLVGLHVDPHPVPDVVADPDLAAAHRVPRHVAGAPVNDDLALVHRVAAAVLRVAVHDDPRPVHE